MKASTELETLIRIAQQASALVLDIYRKPFDVEMKGPEDPVTIADRQANDLICEALRKTFSASIVAEEDAPTGEALRQALSSEEVFFVDPVDGTWEFVEKKDEFCVMIGLCKAGVPTLGVVAAPVTGMVYAGEPGTGAFSQTPTGSRSAIRVSPQTTMSEATLMVSRSHRPDLLEQLKQELGFGREQTMGSVGLKVCRVAVGGAEIYLHGGGGAKRWDTCGPEAILRAAGGDFSDLDGTPINYRAEDLVVREGIVATNAVLHTRVVQVTQRLRRERLKKP